MIHVVAAELGEALTARRSIDQQRAQALFEMSQPALSKHLKVLVGAGVALGLGKRR